MVPRWTETTKRMVVVTGVILVLILVYLTRATLLSLLVAAVLAYALYPLVAWLHRRLRFPHTVATVVIYVLLLAALAATPVLVVPVVIDQVQVLRGSVGTLLVEARDWLRTTLETWRFVAVGGSIVDLSPLVDPALEALRGSIPAIPPLESWLPDLFGTIGGVASTITSAAIAFFLTLLYSFYMVKDMPLWQERMEQLVPENYRPEFDELRRRLGAIWRSFFRGQLLFCLVMGVLTWLLLTILGIEGSVPLAILVGLLELVPNLGPLIALVPIAIVALISGSSTIPLANGWVTVITIGAYGIIQVLGSNFLAPLIIGGSVDLPPLVMLVGVVAGASVAGLIGAFLATPVLASARVLAMYAYNKILDRPPFPELTPAQPPGEDAPEEPAPGSSEQRPAGEEGP